MADYYLTKIPDETWRRVKAAAAAEGLSIRAVLLGMLDRFASAAPAVVQDAFDRTPDTREDS